MAISDKDAARLIEEHFPKLQASELKYRSLSRRSGNHPRLLGLQRDILTNYKSVTPATSVGSKHATTGSTTFR